MFPAQFEKIIKWQDKTFPKSTALSKLKHLQKEVDKELIPELEQGKNPDIDEYADLLFLVFGSASKCGYTYWEIINAIDEKFKVNQARDWNEPDKDGVYLHKK